MSRDGSRVFVAGSAFSQTQTVAYDAGTGARLWAIESNDGAYGFEPAIAASPVAASVFVTGASYDDAGDADYLTLAYRAQ
jgi:hypothetical protein